MKKVALFSTCIADFAAPGPATAAKDVLTRLGWDVEVPTRQSCCGQPALNSGFPDEAAKLVTSWLDTFSRYEHVVTIAGSCAAMLLHHGPELVAKRRHKPFPKLWEFSQFLVEHHPDIKLHFDARVTYHDSCHMTRMLGERTTPRQVLSKVDGLTLVEMADSDTCCGFGGTFSVKFPEVSTAMADMKLGTVQETAADYLVSSDPGCLTHLAARAKDQKKNVKTLHLAELVQMALREDGSA